MDKDGTPYQASDPALLTWVHVAECSRFMASHLRYKRTVVSVQRREDYFRESAEIARRLGAKDIPQTPNEVADYLEAMRPQLRCDERTREVAEVLLTTRLPGRLSQPVGGDDAGRDRSSAAMGAGDAGTVADAAAAAHDASDGTGHRPRAARLGT